MIYFGAYKENFHENILSIFTPLALEWFFRNCTVPYQLEYTLLEHYKIIVLWGCAGAIIGTTPVY